MSYFGKEFVLDSQENFAELLETFGDKMSAEVKKAILTHKSIFKLVKNGDQFTLSMSTPTGAFKDVTFKSGVEMDDDLGGQKAKATNTVAGDTLTSVLKFDNGVTFTIKREFSNNQMLVTTTSSTGVSAKRIYKA